MAGSLSGHLVPRHVRRRKSDPGQSGVVARHQIQMQRLMGDGLQVLIPPDAQQAQGKATGLARRALRLHAPRLSDRARRRALRPAPDHDRAGLRPHEVQPPLRPLLTPRQIGLPVGVAADHCHPQLAQALQAHQRPDHRLIGRPQRPAARRPFAPPTPLHRHGRGKPAELRNSLRPTQQQPGPPSGKSGLLLCQEAGFFLSATGRRSQQASRRRRQRRPHPVANQQSQALRAHRASRQLAMGEGFRPGGALPMWLRRVAMTRSW